MLSIRGLGNHYIIISISRAIKHPPSVFIVTHLTNPPQSMDLQAGKAAGFGANPWGSSSPHLSFFIMRSPIQPGKLVVSCVSLNESGRRMSIVNGTCRIWCFVELGTILGTKTVDIPGTNALRSHLNLLHVNYQFSWNTKPF